MKKLESLKKLLEIVKQNELARSNYCKDGNNCVIGHLLKMGGVTQEYLLIMDGREEEINIYDNWYGINSIVRYIKDKDIKDDIVDKTLGELGFNIRSDEDMKILTQLQKTNDVRGKDELERELKYIISKLSEIQSEEN
jgi:hypothetical protein